MKRTFVFLVGVSATVSHAGLASVSGLGDIIPAASGGYTANFFNDANAIVHGWDEKQNHTLANALRIDATGVGTWSLANDSELSIAAGTTIDSHMLSFDPLQTRTVGSNESNQVQFTFDQKIIGVIYTSISQTNSKMYESDHLIGVGSAPGWYGSRALESGESLTILDDYNLTLNITASSPGDHVRVITEAVPEPGTMAALGLGLAALGRRRKRA